MNTDAHRCIDIELVIAGLFPLPISLLWTAVQSFIL
jgi:hypothetical protein